ncbi:MAG TPA: excalibur calcium-binding domain-containing protein [Rhizomicrobium sp.]|nr:excalibur calcium-binding domain-containing protein [Rhizomicrobium sp.]
MDSPDNWLVREGHDPSRDLKDIQAKFSAVTRGHERRLWWRGFFKSAMHPAPSVLFLVVFLGLVLSPFPPVMTFKHLLAMRNCASARWIGLASARKGAPGYWPWLDRDEDGIACEPWPRSGNRF